jgi:hypothetical protein
LAGGVPGVCLDSRLRGNDGKAVFDHRHVNISGAAALRNQCPAMVAFTILLHNWRCFQRLGLFFFFPLVLFICLSRSRASLMYRPQIRSQDHQHRNDNSYAKTKAIFFINFHALFFSASL